MKSDEVSIVPQGLTTTTATTIINSVNTAIPGISLTKPLQINDKFLVQWRGTNRGVVVQNNELSYIYLPAVIIERRLTRHRCEKNEPNKSNESPSSTANKRKRRIGGTIGNGGSELMGTAETLDNLPADAVEYYIHYIDHDRYVVLDTLQSYSPCNRLLELTAFVPHLSFI
jgi:hypothetical protein